MKSLAGPFVEGEFDAAPLFIEIACLLDEREASIREFHRNGHASDIAAGILLVLLEVGYFGRAPDTFAGTESRIGILSPECGVAGECEGRVFAADSQGRSRFHLIRPFVTESDAVIEDACTNADVRVVSRGQIFVEFDGSGRIFPPSFKSFLRVFGYFLQVPSFDSVGNVLVIDFDAELGWLQNGFVFFLQRLRGFAVVGVEFPDELTVRRGHGDGLIGGQNSPGKSQTGNTAEDDRIFHKIGLIPYTFPFWRLLHGK